jgi:hypothetical protein
MQADRRRFSIVFAVLALLAAAVTIYFIKA